MSQNLQRLLECLSAQRDTIVQQWQGQAMKRAAQDNPVPSHHPGEGYRNPVAHILRTNLPALFDALLGDRPPESYLKVLDPVVRVRAVQDLSASEAVGFVFALKEIVRRMMPDRARIDPDGSATAVVESRIDSMAMRAFDVYMGCRRQLCEIRLNESRRRTYVSDRLAARFKDGAKDTP